MRRPSQASVCNTAKGSERQNVRSLLSFYLHRCCLQHREQSVHTPLPLGGVRGGRDTKPYEAISLMQEVVASAEPTPVRIAMMSFIQKLMFAFFSSFMVHLLSAYSPPALLPPVPPVPPVPPALAGSARDMLPCPLLSA